MRTKTLRRTLVLAVLANAISLLTLAVAYPASAQRSSTRNNPLFQSYAASKLPQVTPDNSTQQPGLPRFKLIDLGTFGGPNSYFAVPLSRLLSSTGTAAGTADTPMADPFDPDCFVTYAFQRLNGVVTQLPALPDSLSSFPFWINDFGQIVGPSEKNVLDPQTGYPTTDSVLWTNGQAINLGGLGGNASLAAAVNNAGMVVGAASNTIPDSYSTNFAVCGYGFPYMEFPTATQIHAYVWQNGVMQDLGTLGTGTDSAAGFVNDAGQVAGQTYIDNIPNPVTGVPTLDPFFWESGKGMTDLGSLGGTCGTAWWLNNRGQVVGQSNLRGNGSFHPFLWDPNQGVMQDLGTLGGNTGIAFAISDSSLVVGRADYSHQSTNHHAFLWRTGVMTDLGVLGDCVNSTAYSVNRYEQIVGYTGKCSNGGGGPGFYSEHGQPIVDLNTLLLPGTDIQVVGAAYINDRGEIAGSGMLPNGDVHAIVLIPVREVAVPPTPF